MPPSKGPIWDHLTQLLTVPHYADMLEEEVLTSSDEEEGLSSSKTAVLQSRLVKSCAGWRKEMAKWVQEEQARINDSDSDGDELGIAMYGRQ